MSISSERVKKWRKSTKCRIVEAMGGKCVCCKYDKCNDALELHHLDPKTKKIGIARMIAHPTNWSTIVEELKKCVLVCCLCHREIESGIRTLPMVYSSFNDVYAQNIPAIPRQDRYCKHCGNTLNTFHKQQRYCDNSCRGEANRKVKMRPSKDELSKLINSISMVKIGKQFGVSDNAVRKWAKSYNLI